MEHGPSLPFLRETLLFLTLTGLLIPLLQRMRINQVVGFLGIGVVVGPFGAGSLAEDWPLLSWVTIPRRQGVQALADLGVIFLMFLIGLELSLQRVWALRKWVFLTGHAQILLSAGLIGALAYGFGNSLEVALVLGLVLSLSSTAVVMQLMSQDRTLASPMGQACFSVLMMQDFAVVPLLIVVDLLAADNRQGVMGQLVSTAALSVGVILLILLVGRKLIAPLFRYFARERQSEVFMALTLLVALGTAGATALAGLSMALGAFLAGLLLSETEYRHEVEVSVEPFKGLLMGLFFMSVGMGIDLREVLRDPLWIASSVLGLLLIKAVVAGGLLRLSGLSAGQALEGGTLLAQGGEFAFIVIGSALASGLLSAQTGQFMLLVVSLSLVATPTFARLGRYWGRRWDAQRSPRDSQHSAAELPDARGHVVVIGLGRVGQQLADVFDTLRLPYLALEHNVERVATLRARGLPVYYGRATRPELLQKLGLDQATCLVVTMDQPAAVARVVRQARRLCPSLPIYARSHDEQHARELRELGATVVVPEMLEAGLVLTAHTLQTVGLPESDVRALVAAERERRGGYGV
jgi:CPA2 family monovalent cation:H+ antiporter-2